MERRKAARAAEQAIQKQASQDGGKAKGKGKGKKGKDLEHKPGEGDSVGPKPPEVAALGEAGGKAEG